MLDVKTLVENATGITKEEKDDLNYDATQCVHNILLRKAHVLATINQDIAKQQILERLDNSTAFVIIDFAMKFLARRYWESMRVWFGKAGMGMHVSCVTMKDDSQKTPKQLQLKRRGLKSELTLLLLVKPHKMLVL